MITPDQLAELKSAMEKFSKDFPGPYATESERDNTDMDFYWERTTFLSNGETLFRTEDADDEHALGFIAALLNLAPSLIERVEELEGKYKTAFEVCKRIRCVADEMSRLAVEKGASWDDVYAPFDEQGLLRPVRDPLASAPNPVEEKETP